MTSKDRWSAPTILLVDDQVPYKSELEGTLRRRGIEARVEVFAPQDWALELGGCQLPEGVEWDKYDVAFVDLDLSGRTEPAATTAADLRGGSVILPEIRRRAPWLPVVWCSGHYRSGDYFIRLAGTFSFDAHFPKQLESQLNFEIWNEIFESAERNSLVRTLNQEFADLGDRAVDLGVSESAFADSGMNKDDALTTVSRLFYGAESIALEPVTPGFSGAKAFRAIARQKLADGSRESEWLIKLSPSAWRLQREADAHLRLQRAGIGMLRSVPLLWPRVVRTRRVAGLAYQFAAGTVDGLAALRSIGFAGVVSRVGELVRAFHSAPARATAPYSNLLRNGIRRSPEMRAAFESIGGLKTKKLLLELFDGDTASSTRLAQLVSYSRSLVHGDMHLSNLMLGDRDILIDFAEATVGPVSFDLARLAASFLLNEPAARDTFSFDVNSSSATLGWFEDILHDVLTEPNDRLLFSELLVAYLVGALRWPAVPTETKEWVRGTLSD